MSGFRVAVPSTVLEAQRLLSTPGSLPIAGGTDLLLDLESGRAEAGLLVSLRRLPYRTVRWEDGELRIGSTAPLAEVARAPGLPDRIPGLATAIAAVGSPALRNRATLGGNLVRSASASDLIPILIALGATVQIDGPSGRRATPVEEFGAGSRRPRLGAGELLAEVRVPAAPSAYLWQRVRPVNDISQVGVAAARHPDGAWALAVGGIVPGAARLRA
ncbi:MAG: FAD binding domain-containing protein, partial [Thermoplasmata archaeon]